MYGGKYVWIIVGWYSDEWWAMQDVECEGKQLKEAADNILETYPLMLSTSPKPTISNRVFMINYFSEHSLPMRLFSRKSGSV